MRRPKKTEKPETNSERAIGRLEGTLESLAEAVQEGQQEARAGRSKIYSELEAIRAEAAQAKHQVHKLQEKLDEATPTIADIKKWKERFIGMQILVAGLFTALGGGIVLGWKWVAVKLGMSG